MKWFFALFFAISLIFFGIFGVNCVYAWVFPIKYSAEIESASLTYKIDEAVIYSVINIESRFDKNAVSQKGAVGLMQLLPSTANMLSPNEKFDLTNPKDNIKLGVKYLSQLIKRFDNLETALCAYNAGPTNVAKWLSDERYSTDGETLKKIPFEETRKYIEKFRTNVKYYNSKIKS